MNRACQFQPPGGLSTPGGRGGYEMGGYSDAGAAGTAAAGAAAAAAGEAADGAGAGAGAAVGEGVLLGTTGVVAGRGAFEEETDTD